MVDISPEQAREIVEQAKAEQEAAEQETQQTAQPVSEVVETKDFTETSPKSEEPAKTEAKTDEANKPDETLKTTEVIQQRQELATQELAEKGELTPATFEYFTKTLGIPEALVNQHVELAKRAIEYSQNEYQAHLGGKDQYNTILQWAGQNLAQDEIDGVQELLNSKNQSTVKMGLTLLKQRYEQTNGTEPKLIQAAAAPATVAGFTSTDDIRAAMNDGRYKTDKTYRAQVDLQKAEWFARGRK